jgi:hypothetical protein
LVLVAVTVMGIVTAKIMCLLFFAQSVALAAAQQGVRAARLYGASHASGAGVAKLYAEQTASGFLTSISTASTSDAATVRITVRGRSLSLVPFPPSVEISEEAAGAIERFTTPRRTT